MYYNNFKIKESLTLIIYSTCNEQERERMTCILIKHSDQEPFTSIFTQAEQPPKLFHQYH